MGPAMDTELQRVEKILQIFGDRGLSALQAIEHEDWEEFEHAMRQRNAAYHNFRAVDFILSARRQDYLMHENLLALGKRIMETDSLLTEAIDKKRQKLAEKLQKIRNHKTKIGRFYSGQVEQAGFQKSI